MFYNFFSVVCNHFRKRLSLIFQFFFCCIWRNYTLKAVIRKLLLQVLEVCVQVLIVLNGASFGVVFETTTTTKTEENKDDVPAWAQALIDSNKNLSDKLTQLETEKAQATRSQQILAKAKEYGIPENYAKRCAIICSCRVACNFSCFKAESSVERFLFESIKACAHAGTSSFLSSGFGFGLGLGFSIGLPSLRLCLFS